MYSEAQKRANYKWNEKNPEKHKEIQKRATAKYYEKNKDEFKERAKAYYYAHKEEILKKRKEQKESKKKGENKMNKDELKILERTLNWANEYFTHFCMVTNTEILSQEEIDKIEDEIEQENAQEYRDYENLLNTAFSIINKYKKGENNNDN